MKKKTIELFIRIFKALKPPPEMTLSEWADRFVRLPAGTSAEPGRWKTSKVPYQREIMDAITDINIKKVVIMSAAQIGKTAMLVNAIGYYVHYDPSPIMVIQPTIDMAEKFSKEKFSPVLRETPVLAERINDKSRNSGNTILQKNFPGGFVTIAGANSPTGLRSHTIRILFADEIDGYPGSAGKEGDPLLLASKRQKTYWNKKQVSISTPTIKDASRIETEYEHSSKGEWNTPCPCCGELQPLTWTGVIFDKENLSEIKYVCCKCGVISSEAEWKEKAVGGTFIHKDPENPVKGFHLNTLASPLATWREVVEDFLLANEEKEKGNLEPMKVWTNTDMAETWEEDGETIEGEKLMKRRENYNCEIPMGVLYLTAGVDTQDDRFEVEVVGWGAEYESWGIRFVALYGDTGNTQDQVWKDLDTFLGQTFEKPDGTKLKITATCIDSGGHRGNQVYKFCKPRFNRRIFAIKGSNNSAAAYIQKPTKNNREQAYLFTIGVDTGKSWLMDRLKLEEPGPGFCHFPREDGRGYDEKYFKGLTSEKRVMRYKMGKSYFAWELKDKGEHRRNEPLDCRNYATAAIEITSLPLKNPEEPEKKQTTISSGKRKRRGRRSGGI